MNEPILIGISLPGRLAPVLNRAAELLRVQRPRADDAEVMALLLICGLDSVIDELGTDDERAGFLPIRHGRLLKEFFL